MAEADAENRHARTDQNLKVFDDLGIFRRVAGAVGQHHAVITAVQDGLRVGVRRHDSDLTAACAQLALDVALHTEVEQRNAMLLLGRCRINLRLTDGDRLHCAGHLICLHLFDHRFVRLMAFGIEDSVHNTAVAQNTGQAAGINPRQADNAFLLQVGIQRTVTAPVGRIIARFAHDKAGNPALARLKVVCIQAIVADERIGHADALSVIGRVGQHFLIARHAGIEHDFRNRCALCTDAYAFKQRAVSQQEIGFLQGSIHSLSSM